MGRRFEEWKTRMRSQTQIGEIESDIAEHEALIASSADSHSIRMLKFAVAEMRENVARLKQNHSRFFNNGRRYRGMFTR